MRFLVAVLGAALFVSTAEARPNVLLVVTDDQRWDTLAYMPTVRDELVDKGVTFTNAFVVNPLCCPSRASILTGTYSHTNGVWRNGAPHGGFTSFRDGSTLATWLSAAGYETALVGKYLNHYADGSALPWFVPPGWDRWYALWGEKGYFGYEITDGLTVRFHGWNATDYSTDVLAAEAVRFIRQSGSEPFFLYFAPKAPHINDGQISMFRTDPAPRHVGALAGFEPWLPPNVNEPDVGDKPRFVRSLAPVSLEALAELRRTQLESLLAVDDALAEMLTALEETGKLENTLIVFTSDNGYSWGEHRRLTKLVPYEESIRVPLVVRYDGLAEVSRKERRFALNIDLAPTIARAAGLSPGGTEGRSLLPLLGEQKTHWRRQFLFEHGSRGTVPEYCAYRGRRWKYVQYATGEEELYDLSRDPYELENRANRGARTEMVMGYRRRVRASSCRPPGFHPLPVRATGGADGIGRGDVALAGSRDQLRRR